MPLKFLKKYRQYNVTSKNLFVISVHHLLDTSTTVDCTISSDSKGQDCLDNVCQRLIIHQPEFFGLRYVVKGKEDELKWIDLERSLSRQLEKYAAGTKIYLRVRHYVTTGVRHLSDEVSRLYYFLQLKSDIHEGKIVCDIRTAILLALYCRQAEYDSHQNDKQTKDYLKRSLVLPKNLQGLANDDNLLDSLIVEVLQQNAGIQHLTQAQAEEMYIQCCQQLDGYGEERFQAKDTLGNDLLLGLAINGMVVTAENGRQYFPWKNFHTVTIDKRTIKVEQNKTDGSIVGSFIFSEAETARYFWKLCITQHKFFKRYIDEESLSMGDVESANGISIGGIESAGLSYDFSDSREDLLMEQQQRAIYHTGGALTSNAEFMSAQSLQSQQQHQQQQQMPHGLMASNNSSALMSSNISLATSHQSGGGGGGGNGALHAHGNAALGPHNWRINEDYAHEYISSSQQLPHNNNMLETRVQSSSCLDLSNNNLHSSAGILTHNSSSGSQNNNHILAADAHERERLKAMLPTYRPAPDYETAMQLKYHTTPSELHNLNNLQYQAAAAMAASTSVMPSYYAGSQPDVHNAGVYADGMLLAAAHRYPDVAQPAAAMHAHHHYSAAAAAAAGNHSLLSPALGGGAINSVYIDPRLQIMRSKPPPPYPVNRLSSSSTPDLAVASHRPLMGYRACVSGSSPDLVSNRNFLNAQYPHYAGGMPVGGAAAAVGSSAGPGTNMLHTYPYMAHIGHSQPYLPPHGTFENLNIIEEQPSIMSHLRQSALSQAAAAQASQSYEQNSPTLAPNAYRASAPGASQQQQQQQQQQQNQTSNTISPAPLQRNAMNGSIEPIYENVPLPQYANAGAAAAAMQVSVSQRNSEQRSSGSSAHTQEAMRNRTSSIQSAPGGMQPPVPAARHHHNHHTQLQAPPHHQQQQQQQQQRAPSPAFDETPPHAPPYATHPHAERAASTELQFLEPVPPQRAMRAASAAPAISVSVSPPQPAAAAPTTQTPPPRQHRGNIMKSAASVSAVDVISPASTSTMRHASSTHDDSLHQQFGAMNLSSASSASMYNSTLDTTATTAHSSSTSSTKEVKRKRRWNILGRSKTPDKQKSATLGREKASANSKLTKTKSAQDDLNLPHRWSRAADVSSRLQPISGQYSKDKLCQILDDRVTDPQLFMEFESISKRRDLAHYYYALMEENAGKNSDPNFLPYDDNRVRLTPTMENRHGYVNASHISATVGTDQRFYIVAQSPHDELTKRIFWQCVWEADVYLVVQLSENLKYIPPNSSQRMEFGQFQVYQEFSQTTERCITSKLRLFHMQSRRYRSVWHLNYTDWAEQNCPRDVNHFLDFLEELNSVRMASIDEVPPGHNTNPPVLIHCLEGGGRSGVTLTSDLLLYTLDHNEDLDIPRVIGQLRHQRDSIIPSLAQYKFIYGLLITYLKRTRLI